MKPDPRRFERPVGTSAQCVTPVLGKRRRMAARFVAQTVSLSTGLLLCLPTHFEAADLSKLAKQGKMILQEK